MLRIAILEKEPCAKDILFECAKIITDMEWSFVYDTKISQLVKRDAILHFDLLILHEMFDTPRVRASLVDPFPRRIVIFCTENSTMHRQDQCKQILYIHRNQIKREMQRIAPQLRSLLMMHHQYTLTYRHVHVILPLQDIYYMEKQDKNIVLHTAKGLFKERKTLKDVENDLQRNGFVRIHASYLINPKHVVSFHENHVILEGGVCLPIARSRKHDVLPLLAQK